MLENRNEAEQSFIGSLLIESSVINHASTLIDPGMFSDKGLSKVYESILELEKEKTPIDLITVGAKLIEKNIKINPQKIIDCIDIVPSATNYKYYSDLISEDYRKRELKILSTNIREFLKTDSSLDVCQEIEKSILNITDIKTDKKTIKDTCKELIRTIQDSRNNQGILSGFMNYDNTIGGYRPGEIHVIAGRPGSGKSALALNIANNVVEAHPEKSAVYFSLEMTDVELLSRLVANHKKISYSMLRKGNLSMITQKLFLDSVEYFYQSKLHIDDDATANVDDLKRVCLNKKSDGDISLVIIDYIQLISSKEKRKDIYESITAISRELKLLAKNLQIPIILLAQMNRKIEDRSDGNPKLSDLSGSGGIENDADSVTFIVKESENGSAVTLHTLKNRHGSTGSTRMDFGGDFMTFTQI